MHVLPFPGVFLRVRVVALKTLLHESASGSLT